jgi:hypothetical protein
MRRRIVLAGTLLLALACGAQAVRHASGPPAHGAGAASVASAASRPSAAVDAAPPVDPLVLLAASKDGLAPGMREVARRHLELGDGGGLELPAPTADTCFRVALAASELVDVSFVDGTSGASLADARGLNPRLGPRGPVCVRKGQASRVSIRGSGAVDALIWASP